MLYFFFWILERIPLKRFTIKHNAWVVFFHSFFGSFLRHWYSRHCQRVSFAKQQRQARVRIPAMFSSAIHKHDEARVMQSRGQVRHTFPSRHHCHSVNVLDCAQQRELRLHACMSWLHLTLRFNKNYQFVFVWPLTVRSRWSTLIMFLTGNAILQ